jgi:hypothetical protein
MLLNQNQLKLEIEQQAAQVVQARAALHERWSRVGSQLHRQATAPRALGQAFLLGFGYGLLNDRDLLPGGLGVLLWRAGGRMATTLLTQLVGGQSS